ncbi:PIR Superfamily Protein [Plasmodium ovale curtisi]|uniref:PIR Superfamily Protein n=1 Tax=Plasmodium ovale curtisi TaxID=864141 RepID=A0A1A8XE03_PLAOA|nr:PIR Superfamily Protein [Plasmodium ovale curtisi]
MSPKILTFYNISNSYKKYKEMLECYKNDDQLIYTFNCDNFTNQYIKDVKGDVFKFCYAEFHQKYNYEESVNALDKYINQINIHTSDKLVKLTDLYDILENFDSEYRLNGKKETCTGDCFDLYIKYVGECRKGYDNDFCNELKNFIAKYNFFIQDILLLKGEKYLLLPVDYFDVVGIIIIPFVLIIGTSLILPLLYKFTPFGLWMRHQIGKNKNTLDNIHEEARDLLHNYEIDNKNSRTQNYNITYNSA